MKIKHVLGILTFKFISRATRLLIDWIWFSSLLIVTSNTYKEEIIYPHYSILCINFIIFLLKKNQLFHNFSYSNSNSISPCFSRAEYKQRKVSRIVQTVQKLIMTDQCINIFFKTKIDRGYLGSKWFNFAKLNFISWKHEIQVQLGVRLGTGIDSSFVLLCCTMKYSTSKQIISIFNPKLTMIFSHVHKQVFLRVRCHVRSHACKSMFCSNNKTTDVTRRLVKTITFLLYWHMENKITYRTAWHVKIKLNTITRKLKSPI